MKLTFLHRCLCFKFVYINYFTCHVCLELFIVSTKGIWFNSNSFLPLDQGLANFFFVMSQTVNIFVFVGHTVSVATTYSDVVIQK